jgi:hypothetical protein
MLLLNLILLIEVSFSHNKRPGSPLRDGGGVSGESPRAKDMPLRNLRKFVPSGGLDAFVSAVS